MHDASGWLAARRVTNSIVHMHTVFERIGVFVS